MIKMFLNVEVLFDKLSLTFFFFIFFFLSLHNCHTNKTEEAMADTNAAAVPEAWTGFFCKMLKERTYVDLYVQVGEHKDTFAAHRFVLAYHSPVLHKMISQSTALLELPNVSSNAFKVVLDHFYGMDPALSSQADSLILQIWDFSKVYEVAGLLTKCESALVNKLSFKNVCGLLKVAEQRKAESLEKSCLEYIRDNKIQFFSESDLTELPSDGAILKKILKSCSCSQRVDPAVWKGVISWIQFHQPSQDTVSTILDHVELEKMTPADLTKHVVPTGVVPTHKLLEVYSSIAMRRVAQQPSHDEMRRWSKSLIWTRHKKWNEMIMDARVLTAGEEKAYVEICHFSGKMEIGIYSAGRMLYSKETLETASRVGVFVDLVEKSLHFFGDRQWLKSVPLQFSSLHPTFPLFLTCKWNPRSTSVPQWENPRQDTHIADDSSSSSEEETSSSSEEESEQSGRDQKETESSSEEESSSDEESSSSDEEESS